MIVRVFVAGNGFSNWQLIVNQFDEKGTVNVVFLESLTMGFPVDRFHVIDGPMILFHNVVANIRAKCLAAYGAAVSGGNGLSAAMELGCIAGETGNGGGCEERLFEDKLGNGQCPVFNLDLGCDQWNEAVHVLQT